LLFIHGAFVTHEPFRPWLERLGARGWPGLAVARRGRLGFGPERAQGLRFQDYLEDTLRVIDGLDEPPILVGHSLGALLAQKAAELGRARALVLLSPAPAAMLTAQAVALPAYLPMLPKILTGRSLVPPSGACRRLVLNRMPESQHSVTHGSLVHESGAVYRELMFGAVHVDPARVRCPTLVLSGAHDHVISTALARFTAERYGATLEIYPEHAHWILGEPGWEKVADRVGDWLDGVRRAGGPSGIAAPPVQAHERASAVAE
jgi:pimeloyl-ACP methyl ester carboxylesterase